MSKVVYETEWDRYIIEERRISHGKTGIWLRVPDWDGFRTLAEATRVADLCADEDQDMRYRVVDLGEDE